MNHQSNSPERDRVHIIAEAGSNHNGDVVVAKQLASVAADSGVDSVKFQFINPESLYLPRYVKNGQEVENPVYAQRAREQLTDAQWTEVFGYCSSIGIPVTASVFDDRGLRFLRDAGAPYVKVASCDLNNPVLLAKVAAAELPAVVSTGMSTLSEIESAVAVFERERALDRLTLLHCVSIYPCPLEATQLFMISVLQHAFGVPVGFSDHTGGSEAAVIAVALGAVMIEKHFTVDRTMPGFDHAHAAEPRELASFVEAVRAASVACEPARKDVTAAELTTLQRARRGLYAARDIVEGEVLREEDVLIVRPASPLGPSDLHLIVGKPVARNIRRYEPFATDVFVAPGEPVWQGADSHWKREMAQKGMLPGNNS